METQLTCFNEKKMIPALCPHFLRDTEHLRLHLRRHSQLHHMQTHRNISALLMFYLFSARDGDSVHGKTPSVHFNMNGHVSLVLLERQRCEIEDGMQSGPDTQG